VVGGAGDRVDEDGVELRLVALETEAGDPVETRAALGDCVHRIDERLGGKARVDGETEEPALAAARDLEPEHRLRHQPAVDDEPDAARPLAHQRASVGQEHERPRRLEPVDPGLHRVVARLRHEALVHELRGGALERLGTRQSDPAER